MENFIRNLSGQIFEQGEKLESEALIVAQKILVNNGMDFIPHSYSSFLKVYNGIKRDGAYLFGATIDDDLDIVDKNKDMMKPENSLLLGYNEFDLLIFNYATKKYQIVDREDFDVIDEYNEDEISYALGQIFNV
jgi:hypothetical protein